MNTDSILFCLGLGVLALATLIHAGVNLRHRTPGERAADHSSDAGEMVAQPASLTPSTLRLMALAGVLRAFRRPQ